MYTNYNILKPISNIELQHLLVQATLGRFYTRTGIPLN